MITLFKIRGAIIIRDLDEYKTKNLGINPSIGGIPIKFIKFKQNIIFILKVILKLFINVLLLNFLII